MIVAGYVALRFGLGKEQNLSQVCLCRRPGTHMHIMMHFYPPALDTLLSGGLPSVSLRLRRFRVVPPLALALLGSRFALCGACLLFAAA